jgi:predicted aminopeptidase
MRLACRIGLGGLLIVCALGLVGCETLGYYAQAVRGQAELWQATRPIDAVVADPAVTPQLKERLQNASRIREFASRELHLPDNRSYRGYADLKRPYVVWNVFATEPYSVKPRQWCFPIAGCVAYRGYFAREQAEAFAAELRRAGNDVYVGGVPAYSTLGFLDDPVLNTFVHYPAAELARLIFHELAHQQVYVSGDTTFNESFAVTVEREGVKRWMALHGSPAALAGFQRAQERRAAFQALVLDYRGRLAQLYAAGGTPAEMAAGKTRIFRELDDAYAELKRSWGGFSGYDRWLGPNANNASLASIAVYTRLVPAFQAMLESAHGDLAQFYAEVKRVAALPREDREAHLNRLLRSETQTAAH